METGGPYLNAALLCEKVLQEKDEVLSVIRVIDRITITAMSSGAPIPDTLPPSIVSFHVLLILKAGLFKGSAQVRLAIQSPGNQVVGETTMDVFLEGDDRGVNLVSLMQIQVQEDGLYWIDVTCAGQLFTRIPLRIIYQRLHQGSLQWPQGA